MNAYSFTAQIFPTLEPKIIRARWSALINSEHKHQLAAVHHLLYSVLLGRDWRKGLTMVTNPRKLANGGYAGSSFFRTLDQLHRGETAYLLLPFADLVTPETLKTIRLILPYPTSYKYRPEQFAKGFFPFEPYILPAGFGEPLTTAEQVVKLSEGAHA